METFFCKMTKTLENLSFHRNKTQYENILCIVGPEIDNLVQKNMTFFFKLRQNVCGFTPSIEKKLLQIEFDLFL